MSTDSDAADHQCDACGKTFDDEESLLEHKREQGIVN